MRMGAPELKRASIIMAIIAFLLTPFTPCVAEEEGRFFLKANAGYSIPFLPALSSELDLQGQSDIQGGLGLSVSLGRTFLERTWALEALFAVAFYPEFNYENDHEDFEGDLSHYDFALVCKRFLLPEDKTIAASIGAGIGYGITNLISGGGKMDSFEAVGIAQFESKLKDNISLLLEGSYCYAFNEDRFEKPFLENVPGDVVHDSEGNPLEDRYSSLEIRAGVIIWLKPLGN